MQHERIQAAFIGFRYYNCIKTGDPVLNESSHPTWRSSK